MLQTYERIARNWAHICGSMRPAEQQSWSCRRPAFNVHLPLGGKIVICCFGSEAPVHIAASNGCNPPQAVARSLVCHTAAFTMTAESRPHAHAHHFLVVFGFVGLGYLAAVGAVDATPAPAAGVARILARTHLGMTAADRGDLLLKLDRRDRPVLAAARDANINGAGRNRSGV